MKRDLDRLLSDALKSSAKDYDSPGPREAFARFERGRTRRRIVYAVGGVAATGAVAAVAFLAVAARPADPDRVERDLQIAGEVTVELAATIPVGDRPSGIDVDETAAWVANAGSGSVSRIDLDTNETTEVVLGGHPDDVALTTSLALVSDPSRGVIVPVDLLSSTVGDPIEIGNAGRHIDIDAEGDVAWVVAEDRWLYRIEGSSIDRVARFSREVLDVAVGAGAVWTRDSYGALGRTPVDGGPARTFEWSIDAGGVADLDAGDWGVWSASPLGSQVLAFEPRGMDVVSAGRVPIRADYAGVVVGDRWVWVLLGSEAGTGRLVRVDPLRHEVAGVPIPLDDKPYDLAATGDEVWVTHAGSATVSRFRLATDP